MKYENWTRADLAKEVRKRRLVDGWMTTYMNKQGLVQVLKFAENIPEGKKVELPAEYVAKLTARKEQSKERVKTAKKNRAENFGSAGLTQREILAKIVRQVPDLVYVGKRCFDEPFESPAGNRAAKTASVFKDGQGNEYLFTVTECAVMKDKLGVKVPPEAMRRATGKAAQRSGAHTLRDLW